MAVTANGWPQLSRFGGSFTAPNGHVCDVVSMDAAVLFAYVAWRMHTEVLLPMTSAYGGRTIAQQKAIYRQQGQPPILSSNHISGTACDFARPGVVYEHFQKGAYRSGYTAAEEARIRGICAATGVMQWGGDFPAPDRDPVHVQVRQNNARLFTRPVSAAKLAAEAKRIGAFVRHVQRACGVTADGLAGPGTITAVRAFQRAHGLAVDGIWGPRSEAAAAGNPAPKPTPPAPPKPPTTMAGVDVSSYQTVAQWRAQHPAFVIAKAHEGLSWHDPGYKQHQAAIHADGLPGIAYSFAWPEYNPEASVTDFLSFAGLRAGDVGVLDFEPYKSKAPESSWPAWVTRWGTEYRRRCGVWPWLYANDDMLTRLAAKATPAQMTLIRRWPLWKAAYAATPGSLHGWPRLTCWQHTDTGGKLDRDIFYGTPAAWTATGKNGVLPAPPKPPVIRKDHDMPDATPNTYWTGKRPLKKGWSSVRVGTFNDKSAQFTFLTGAWHGVTGLYLALDNVKPGTVITVRLVEMTQKNGKWVIRTSFGECEHIATPGWSIVNQSQVFATAPGSRLHWEVALEGPGVQLRGTTRSLIWKG